MRSVDRILDTSPNSNNVPDVSMHASTNALPRRTKLSPRMPLSSKTDF
jgi:hypothetical protein